MCMRSFHMLLKWLLNTSPGVAAVSQHLMAVSPVTTISSEAEDLGEDASECSSRTSTGSAETESLLSRLKAAGQSVL